MQITETVSIRLEMMGFDMLEIVQNISIETDVMVRVADFGPLSVR